VLTMKLPTRLAGSLTTAIVALMALSAEIKMSHPLHVGCVIAGGFVLGLLVPGGATAIAAGQDTSVPPAPGAAAVEKAPL
jgi:hypothetical protein